jgi:hypothetical protein
MTKIVTKNCLEEFDLCLALSQSAINSQLTYAWSAWKRRVGFQDNVHLFKVMKDGSWIETEYGLSAALAPLSVSLTVQNARAGQVQVNVHLLSGTIHYFDTSTKTPSDFKVTDWKISFITDLGKKAVDFETLKKIDDGAAESAKTLAGGALPDSVLSIEYLFLQLTKIDLLLTDNKGWTIPENVPDDARTKALAALNSLFRGVMNGEYLVGTVVRRKAVGTPTFALTNFLFDIHADWSVPKASTLAYLGEFSGRPLPADVPAATNKLKDAWLRPEQLDGRESNISGVMAIRHGTFLDDYLIPFMTKALINFDWGSVGGISLGHPPGVEVPPKLRKEGLTWIYSDEVTTISGSDDGATSRIRFTRGFRLRVSVQPQANGLSIEGTMFANVHWDVTALNGGLYLGHAYFDGERSLSGNIELLTKNAGAGFTVFATAKAKSGEPIVKNEIGGTLRLEEVVKVVLKELGVQGLSLPSELVQESHRVMSTGLADHLEAAIAKFSADQKDHAFVPPGGGVFTFTNPRFSHVGDLFFDVKYIAP